MDFAVDRHSQVPLRAQIARAIRQRIESGECAPGSRLWSGRDLAERLQVNRATVQLSLRDLVEEGVIEADVGRGTFVRTGPRDRDADPDAMNWARRLPDLVSPGFDAAENSSPPTEDVVSLSRAVAHPSMFPADAIRAAFDRAFQRLGGRALEYPSPAGWEPLRRALADRFAARGFDMNRNEILIVNGSQQGLDLASRLLVNDGPVLTSSPTFSGALELFRARGARVSGCAIDSQGLDVEAVGRELARRRAELVYTVPYLHNPTGVTLAEDRCRRLLELARQHDTVVLEDDWLGELREDSAPAPLKTRDPGGHVLSLGTVSKVLAPGLRIGWLIVPRPLLSPLLALKRRSDLASSLPSQLALLDLIESGFLDEHLPRVRVEFEERRAVMDEVFDRCFPEPVQLIRPHGGMTAWIRLPDSLDVHRVVAAAASRGVELPPGTPFDPSNDAVPGFRIAHAAAPRERLAEALEAVAELLQELLTEGPKTAAPPLV